MAERGDGVHIVVAGVVGDGAGAEDGAGRRELHRPAGTGLGEGMVGPDVEDDVLGAGLELVGADIHGFAGEVGPGEAAGVHGGRPLATPLPSAGLPRRNASV